MLLLLLFHCCFFSHYWKKKNCSLLLLNGVHFSPIQHTIKMVTVTVMINMKSILFGVTLLKIIAALLSHCLTIWQVRWKQKNYIAILWFFKIFMYTIFYRTIISENYVPVKSIIFLESFYLNTYKFCFYLEYGHSCEKLLLILFHSVQRDQRSHLKNWVPPPGKLPPKILVCKSHLKMMVSQRNCKRLKIPSYYVNCFVTWNFFKD